MPPIKIADIRFELRGLSLSPLDLSPEHLFHLQTGLGISETIGDQNHSKSQRMHMTGVLHNSGTSAPMPSGELGRYIAYWLSFVCPD
jgi:hypothetical protein